MLVNLKRRAPRRGGDRDMSPYATFPLTCDLLENPKRYLNANATLLFLCVQKNTRMTSRKTRREKEETAGPPPH
eukprot:9469049-Pyramimonas_sp.AAC.1